MKLKLIIEKNQKDLVAAAQKLNQQVQQFGESELQGLVRDPARTVDLIRRGMTAKEFIFADDRWIRSFLEQWHLLPDDVIMDIFQDVHREIVMRIEKLRTEGVLHDFNMLNEGMLSGVGGFLTKLAKMAWLLLQLLVASGGGKGNMNTRSIKELRVFNPYAVFRLTKDLQLMSYRVAGQQQQQKRP